MADLATYKNGQGRGFLLPLAYASWPKMVIQWIAIAPVSSVGERRKDWKRAFSFPDLVPYSVYFCTPMPVAHSMASHLEQGKCFPNSARYEYSQLKLKCSFHKRKMNVGKQLNTYQESCRAVNLPIAMPGC